MPELSMSFAEHVQQSRQRLERDKYHSEAMGVGRSEAIDAVMPFEMGSEHQRVGVLLIHGLSDSPFTFRDIAAALARRGIRSRSILLSGHGSRAEDSLKVRAGNWRRQVRAQIADLQKQCDKVWVGGYSMGAVLATLEGLDLPNIAGLILWAPAWRCRSNMVWTSRLLFPFRKWHSVRPERDFARYSSFSINAIHQYYHLTLQVKRQLNTCQRFRCPVYIVASEADATINSQFVLQQFLRLRQPDSRLVWYGQEELSETGVLSRSDYLPEQRIRAIAHTAVTFSPANPHYGKQGDYRNCLAYVEDSTAFNRCLQDPEPWFSEYGLVVEGRYPARLTFNPYFEEMMADLGDFILDR
ncbi:hypothetical protein C4K68_16970 [Pokkaliibacter plantistimulans]|uniref:AB hydrolase-1 domain-containing protein n=1 Tax=Proteobacteria bacterium 228 TaxID=2083153 RepID=A0A2S5KP67_9PROT|nr:alpha/beta fold hydrolase [Pokkaliibacter plantistimulans]PPC76086.1 hypothetical protein C4K68_16970 [Pokkaliibacter plantistimulans]